MVCYNGNDGIIASGTINGNTASYNSGDGIYANRCMVTDNTANSNKYAGISVNTYCNVIGNSCNFNGNGADGAGISAFGNNRIEQNHVTNNDQGIKVWASYNLIVKNSAWGNTTEYDIAGVNEVGTISTDPTTANAWANFDL
jgi:parallel beta-helix repeat protein